MLNVAQGSLLLIEQATVFIATVLVVMWASLPFFSSSERQTWAKQIRNRQQTQIGQIAQIPRILYQDGFGWRQAVACVLVLVINLLLWYGVELRAFSVWIELLVMEYGAVGIWRSLMAKVYEEEAREFVRLTHEGNQVLLGFILGIEYGEGGKYSGRDSTLKVKPCRADCNTAFFHVGPQRLFQYNLDHVSPTQPVRIFFSPNFDRGETSSWDSIGRIEGVQPFGPPVSDAGDEERSVRSVENCVSSQIRID